MLNYVLSPGRRPGDAFSLILSLECRSYFNENCGGGKKNAKKKKNYFGILISPPVETLVSRSGLMIYSDPAADVVISSAARAYNDERHGG